jgi:hypothetical protein
LFTYGSADVTCTRGGSSSSSGGGGSSSMWVSAYAGCAELLSSKSCIGLHAG